MLLNIYFFSFFQVNILINSPFIREEEDEGVNND